MAYITFKNMDEYELKISKLAKKSTAVCKVAVYDGAKVIANALKQGISNLPIEEGRGGLPPYAPPGTKLTGVSTRQRKDLVDSMGIAKMREENGYIQTKVGWDGYGSVRTKTWPKGIPNIVLMRSIESGSRFRVKNPVVRRTVKEWQGRAITEMAHAADKFIEKEF